jgi:hypothetical protein
VAAGLALVVGAVTIGHGLGGHDETLLPADRLPAPAPFDGPHLTVATHGWTPTWGPPTDAVREKIATSFGGYCLANLRGGVTVIKVLADSHEDGALALMSDYGARRAAAQSAWRRVERQVDGCTRAHLVTSFSTSNGVEGHTYRIDPIHTETAPEYLWIITTGSQVGELKIFGQTKALPADNNGPVASFLLASMRNPATYDDQSPQSGGHRMDPTETLGQGWAQDFGPALAGWANTWEPQLHELSGPQLPSFEGDFAGDEPRPGETVNVGRNGHEWVHWYGDENAATSAIARLQHNLTSCPTPFTFHTVTLSDGRPVLVGVGPEVVWVERVASHVLLLHIPSGSSSPPDEVSVKVGAVLEHVLEQPATTTMSPDGHTTTPGWMKKEIEAAPTFGP